MVPAAPGKTNHRTPIPMNDILSVLLDNETDELKIEYNGETLYSSGEVLMYLYDMYCDYSYIVPDRFRGSAINHFVDTYKRFVSRTVYSLYMAGSAYFAEYDPISNYDLSEVAADGTRRASGSVATTPTGTSTVTTTTDQAGFDSAGDGVQVDKVTAVNSYDEAKSETVSTPENDQSIDFDGETLTGYNEGSEHRLRRHGNIGVTTTQQMISSELDLRKTDLLKWYLRQFADEYIVYIG